MLVDILLHPHYFQTIQVIIHFRYNFLLIDGGSGGYIYIEFTGDASNTFSILGGITVVGGTGL
jgi:hypothetical protein